LLKNGNIDESKKDSILQDIIKKPDTSINNFVLLNHTSIEDNIKGSIILVNENNDIAFRHIKVYNTENHERITMLFYPGSSKNMFSKFILEYSLKPMNNDIIISCMKFKTSNGAFLGMSENELLNKYHFDNKYTYEDSKIKKYGFEISDYISNSFLQRYNLPVYQAYYYVRDSILERIEFGFEYP
jgi:hypothetical protein